MKKKLRNPTKAADLQAGMTLPHASVLGVLGKRMDRVDDCVHETLNDLGRVNALLQAANVHGDTDVVGFCSDLAERLLGETIEHFNTLDAELTGLFEALQAKRRLLCLPEEGGAQ